MTEEAKLTSTR